MKDEYGIYEFLQMPDLELARAKQTQQDLEDLAAYRRIKMQAYDAWSKSMGKEFTYYNEKGELVKIDVLAKRAEAAATQDAMAGTEIGPQFTVRKAYRDYLSSPGGVGTGDTAALGVRNSLPGIDRRGDSHSPIRWTPVAPPVDLTWFDRVCLWFQRTFTKKVKQ